MAIQPLQHRFDGPPGAPVVLLIPTVGARWSLWEPQLPELTREHRVLRIDLPGHGGERPRAEPGGFTPQALAACLEALLDVYALDRVAVAGLGLGAMVSVALADRAPRRVARLALLSGALPRRNCRRWNRHAQQARSRGMGAVVSQVTRPWFTPGFVGCRPDIVDSFAAAAARMTVETFAACCEAATADMGESLARVRAPALVVSAAHDPQAPPLRGRLLAAALPHARFEVVNGAAHLANVERAERVNDLLLGHLSAHGRVGRRSRHERALA